MIKIYKKLSFLIDKIIIKIKLIFLGWPALFIILLIRRCYKIKIINLDASRIGALAGQSEYALRLREYKKEHDYKYIMLLENNISNQQYVKMLKRKVIVIKNNTFSQISRYFEKKIKSGLFTSFSRNGNEENVWMDISPQLEFTESEVLEGKKLLERMGIKEGEEYVCIHARDSAYLSETNIKDNSNNIDFSYHDYRDCSISNYLPAAEYLTSRGIWVIRMGAVVEQPLDVSNDKIVDYATKYRTALGDIYLMSQCKFFLGNTAGLFYLATVFDVPVALANYTPLASFPRSARKYDMMIQKKYLDIKNNKFLSLNEVISKGASLITNSNKYCKLGIEVIENTKEEILEFAIEMNERIDNEFRDSEENRKLQNQYRQLLPEYKRYSIRKSSICFGTHYIRKNQYLLN